LTKARFSTPPATQTFASICAFGHFSVKSHPRPNFAPNRPG